MQQELKKWMLSSSVCFQTRSIRHNSAHQGYAINTNTNVIVAGIKVWFLIHLIANWFGSLSLERRLLINVQYCYDAAALLYYWQRCKRFWQRERCEKFCKIPFVFFFPPISPFSLYFLFCWKHCPPVQPCEEHNTCMEPAGTGRQEASVEWQPGSLLVPLGNARARGGLRQDGERASDAEAKGTRAWGFKNRLWVMKLWRPWQARQQELMFIWEDDLHLLCRKNVEFN